MHQLIQIVHHGLGVTPAEAPFRGEPFNGSLDPVLRQPAEERLDLLTPFGDYVRVIFPVAFVPIYVLR